MERYVERVSYISLEKANMDYLHPKPMPTALFWVDYNILLASFRRLSDHFFTSVGVIELSTLLLGITIHVLLLHLVFLV